jgi:2-desacetyl-2-hydroxyethyl bacteriochlorophyllide A dehydrogenase
MKSIICTSPYLLIEEEVPQPLPKEGFSILKVERIGICGTDLHGFEGTQPFFSYPRILGHELAASVVQTSIQSLSVGDFVTIIPYFNCGNCIACISGKPNCCVHIQVFGVHIDGGMQEYISVPDASIIAGNGLGLDALALVEPLAIGAHGIRRAGVQAGEYVLVMGAGPIGLGTIEMAKIAGAKVIVLDVNEHRLQFCTTQLGVEATVNPFQVDALAAIQELTGNNMPQVVIDATGNLKAINNGFNYLAHGGRYVLIGLQNGDIQVSHPAFHKREATLMSSRNATRQDFDLVMQNILSGRINPNKYITHKVSLHEVVDQFASWLDPANGVIKAMIEL